MIQKSRWPIFGFWDAEIWKFSERFCCFFGRDLVIYENFGKVCQNYPFLCNSDFTWVRDETIFRLKAYEMIYIWSRLLVNLMLLKFHRDSQIVVFSHLIVYNVSQESLCVCVCGCSDIIFICQRLLDCSAGHLSAYSVELKEAINQNCVCSTTILLRVAPPHEHIRERRERWQPFFSFTLWDNSGQSSL